MSIWSQYLRDKDAWERAACTACLGTGMETMVDRQEGMMVCGEGICPGCKGTGYAVAECCNGGLQDLKCIGCKQ